MSDKPPENRRPDPFRREPPVLDLKAKEVKQAAPQPAPAASAQASASTSSASSASSASAGAGKPAAAASAKAASIPGVYSTGAKAAATPAAAAPQGAAPAKAAPAPTDKPAPAGDIPARRRPSLDFETAKPVQAAPSAKPAPAALSTPKPAPAAAVAPAGVPTTPPRPAAQPSPAATGASKAAPSGVGAAAAGAAAGAAVAGAASPAEAATKPTSARIDPPRSGLGFGSVLTSGILGGLIGAGLLYGADTYLGGQDSSDDSRIAALEQRVGSAPASAAGNAALERRLAALETSNRALSDQLAGRPASATAPSAAAPADTALPGRVAALEDTTNKALAEMRTQLGAIRTSLDDQNKQSGAAAATNATALAAVTSRVASLQSQAAGQAEAANTAVQAMQARLGDDEKRLSSLTAEFAKFGPAAAQAGLRMIVAGRVGDALRDGQPLGPLLATAQKIGAPAEVITPLQPYAEAPAPSTAALSRDFEPLGRRMIDAARGPATSITDRLKRMADRIVTVRAVVDTSGTDIDAQVARVEAALERGALGEAAAAWDALPDAAKAVSSAWATQLKQRAAASDAARRLSTDALAAIDASLR